MGSEYCVSGSCFGGYSPLGDYISKKRSQEFVVCGILPIFAEYSHTSSKGSFLHCSPAVAPFLFLSISPLPYTKI